MADQTDGGLAESAASHLGGGADPNQSVDAFCDLIVRQALPRETEKVSDVLAEAARWLADRGQTMWRDNELLPESIAQDVEAGLFYVAAIEGQIVGVVKFQLEDLQFWPDSPAGHAAYVHRLAVRRKFAGRGVSTALLSWAVERARALGRTYLRLDCEAARTRLRAVYERFGFKHHSDREIGPYYVSRYEYTVRKETSS